MPGDAVARRDDSGVGPSILDLDEPRLSSAGHARLYIIAALLISYIVLYLIEPDGGVRRIGAFEAKNRLSDLLAKAERGQRIYITRRGKRVAVLMPPDSIDLGKESSDGRSLMEEIRAFRAAAKPGPEPLRKLIEEGRR